MPTSTDPLGWHWNDKQGGLIQVTALSFSRGQHETYLGFMSGVIFGVAGGAFVSLLQETLHPARRRRAAPLPNGGEYRMFAPGGRIGKQRIGRKAVWLLAGALALAAIVVAVVFAVTHTNGTSPPATGLAGNVQPQSAVLIVDDCYNAGRIEPRRITLTCGDGTAVAQGLSWSQWSSSAAHGRGTVNEVSCVPDCADGTDVAYHVRLTLSEPVQAGGKTFFTRIALTYLDDGPSGAHTAIYMDCFHTPPSPSVPRCPGHN